MQGRGPSVISERLEIGGQQCGVQVKPLPATPAFHRRAWFKTPIQTNNKNNNLNKDGQQ